MRRVLKFASRAFSTSAKYDLVVVGGGPGGYVAAIRAAQLGMSVGCIEKRGSLGGTCLNVGCIPSKALLHASELYMEAGHFKQFGFHVPGEIEVNVSELQKTKTKVVNGLTKGVEHLFKKNGVDYFKGTGEILSANKDVKVVLLDGSGDEIIEAENIIIATGSQVTELPFLEIDEEIVLSSTGGLDIPEVPEKFAVLGTGAIALELGSVWSRLGADVTVFYYREEVARYLDNELRKPFRKALEKQGLNFMLDTDVTGADMLDGGIRLHYTDMNSGETDSMEFDKVLVSVGRKPYFDGVGVETLGIELTDAGQIQVDEVFQTNVPGIYAIGDCIPGPMLAHKAEEDGYMCVEYLKNGTVPHVDYNLVPGVVYTKPEVAQVGLRTQDLEEGTFISGTFPFAGNGRCRAMLEADGMCKVIADKDTHELLGMHLMGPHVSEMIMEGALIMHAGLTVDEIAEACHPHPTLSEVIKEAAMDCVDQAIHK